MNSIVKRVLSGVAALGIALSGLALGAASANAADVVQPKSNPTQGTITINKQSGYTIDHSFEGWNLAKLVNVSAQLTSSGKYSLSAFQVDTTDSYVSAIETAMKSVSVKEKGQDTTLYALYAADATYFFGQNKPDKNNPMGWIASHFSGDDREDGTKWQTNPDSVLRKFVTELSKNLANNTGDNSTYRRDFKSNGTPLTVAQGVWLLNDITTQEDLGKGTDYASRQESASIPILMSTTYEGVEYQPASGGVKTVAVDRGNRGAIGAIEVKNTLPTIAKEVVTGDANRGYRSQTNPDYAVGDTVSYRIYSRVPVFTGYAYNTNYQKNYYSYDAIPANEKPITRHFTIVDTASKQLTVSAESGKAVESVQLVNQKGDVDETLVEGSDYDVIVQPWTDNQWAERGNAYEGGTTTRIDLGKYVNMTSGSKSAQDGVLEGDTVVVIFKATLNKYAAISTPDAAKGNPNKVTLVYSNNPKDCNDMGYLPGNEVNVYTFKFQLKKTDEAYKNSGKGQALPGAKFVVMAKDTTEHKGKYLATTKDADGHYSVSWLDAKPTATDGAQNTSDGVFTSDAKNGVVEGLEGLDAGTYTVSEIQAPEGYIGFTLPTFDVSIWPQHEWRKGVKSDGYVQTTWNCAGFCTTGADGKTAWGDWTIGDKSAVKNAGIDAEPNGTVRVDKGDDSGYVYRDTAKGTPAYQLNVYNAKYLTQLPLTGGIGLMMIVVVAVLLFGASGILVIRSRKASAARRSA